MHIPPRLLRAHVESLPTFRRPLSAKERDREARILAAARTLMAGFGRGALTVGKLAHALSMSPATIRRHFSDMDAILGEILLRHLQAVARAMGQVPPEAADQQAARRAAYYAATRTSFGAVTEDHLLLIRERHTLPPDLAAPVEQIRRGLGETLAGAQAQLALTLLDTPDIQLEQIDVMLATLHPPAAVPPVRAQMPRPAVPPPQPARLSRKLRRLAKHLAHKEARAGPAACRAT